MSRFVWFLKSDVDLVITHTDEDGMKVPYAFTFYCKNPRSKSYKFHTAAKIEELYGVKEILEKGIKANKDGLVLFLKNKGFREEVEIHEGSMQKALKLINTFYRFHSELRPE